MIRYLIVYIVFLGTEIKAQTKKIFFKIDSLNYDDRINQLHIFRLTVGNQGFLNLGDNFDSTKVVSFINFPNYKNLLELENESSTIQIPIDLNGSKIILKNAYFLNTDTLSIDQWTIYKTQALDTSYTIIEYCKMLNGKLADTNYKLKKIKNITKAKSPPLTIRLLINGKIHDVKLTLNKSPDLMIMHGHGYKPRNCYKKNGDYKKRVTKFHINESTYRYSWLGEIDLKSR